VDRWLIVAAVAALVVGVWWASRRAREARTAPARVDPADFGLDPGAGSAAVLFTSPYCLACTAWIEALEAADTPYLVVDVSERGDLANRYRVRKTPLVLAVRRDSGEIAAAYDSEPTSGDVSHISALVAA
jgi:hypothetical protein